MKATISKLSICECGFKVLADKIGLGTVYNVEPMIEDDFIFICGGCKKEHKIRGIFVYKRRQSEGGFLPKDIFDLAMDEKAHAE